METKITRDEVLERVSRSGDLLSFYPEYKDDDEIAFNAVLNWGQAIRDVSERLRDNENLAMIAANDDPMGTNLAFLSERLRDNENIVSLYIMKHGCSIAYASDRLKNNKVIGIKAVKSDGESLACLSERLRDDMEVVTAACHENGESLQYVSERLRDDDAVVKTALLSLGGGENIYYASERLRGDFVMALIAVTSPHNRGSNNILSFLSDDLRDNKQIVLNAVLNSPRSLMKASDRLKDDYDIVNAAFEKDHSALGYASERLQINPAFLRPWLEEKLEGSDSYVLKNIILKSIQELSEQKGYDQDAKVTKKLTKSMEKEEK